MPSNSGLHVAEVARSARRPCRPPRRRAPRPGRSRSAWAGRRPPKRAGLPLGQVPAVQRVGLGRGRVPRVGAHDPWAVTVDGAVPDRLRAPMVSPDLRVYVAATVCGRRLCCGVLLAGNYAAGVIRVTIHPRAPGGRDALRPGGPRSPHLDWRTCSTIARIAAGDSRPSRSRTREGGGHRGGGEGAGSGRRAGRRACSPVTIPRGGARPGPPR